ncbi:MAG: hypothetical protein KC561_06865, partial [Myxococcales bacterium]|nr:hypothetical protein [Myxococcales bacterium]
DTDESPHPGKALDAGETNAEESGGTTEAEGPSGPGSDSDDADTSLDASPHPGKALDGQDSEETDTLEAASHDPDEPDDSDPNDSESDAAEDPTDLEGDTTLETETGLEAETEVEVPHKMAAAAQSDEGEEHTEAESEPEEPEEPEEDATTSDLDEDFELSDTEDSIPILGQPLDEEELEEGLDVSDAGETLVEYSDEVTLQLSGEDFDEGSADLDDAFDSSTGYVFSEEESIELGGRVPRIEPREAPKLSGDLYIRLEGRIYGPFRPDKLEMLLESGTLTGLETASADLARWTPLAYHPRIVRGRVRDLDKVHEMLRELSALPVKKRDLIVPHLGPPLAAILKRPQRDVLRRRRQQRKNASTYIPKERDKGSDDT